MKAILLSGGLDSCALAFWLRPEVAVTVDYGQLPAQGEIRSAAAICSELGIEHIVVRSDAYFESPPKEAKGSLWWPYRNQLLVTLAAIRLHGCSIVELQLGLVKGDVFQDCTPKFLGAVTDLMLLQEDRILVQAPAINLTPLELLLRSGIPSEFLGVTMSCHLMDTPCGRCAGCRKNRELQMAYVRIAQGP